MATTWSRVRNTPGLTRDVALVTVLLLVGGIATAYLFSRYEVITPFEDRYEFSAQFDQAPAIQLGSRQEVRIAGVPVGKIVDAAPEEDHARLTFSLEPQHQVYRDARLVLRSKTPLNVMYVALDPGTPSAGELPEGGTIPLTQTELLLQPYKLLDQLDPRARAALTDLVLESDVALADARATLPAGVDALGGATRSFEPVLDALQRRRENLRHLVTSVSQIAAAAGEDDQRLAHLMNSMETTLAVVAERDDELGDSLAKVPGVARTLRGSLTSARELSDVLSPTLDSVSAATGRLPGALHRLNNTVTNVRDVARKAGPVIDRARPVLRDLRPLTADLNTTLGDLRPVTSNLPAATAQLVPWLDHLGAFVYNTSSSFSLGDTNGGLGRANLVVKSYDPLGGGR
jgi:phospholipid/cholesterol/gamma-HCH transport system substrate-binding protein